MDENKSLYLEYDKDGNIVIDDSSVSIEYVLNEYLNDKPKQDKKKGE